jgi:SNF2 family DNA or RNA helicase
MDKIPESFLRVSQKETIPFIINNPFCAIFSEMGFGKTIAVLTAVEKLIKSKNIKRTLVVSTLMVSRETWPNEVKSWAHTADIRYQLILGNANQRLKKLESNVPIHIINQENFVWLTEKTGLNWPYEMIIFDDAKGFKSAKRKNYLKTAVCCYMNICPVYEKKEGTMRSCTVLCKRFKQPPARYSRFGALCSVRPKIKRLVHLTGTPSSKELLDLWPMIFTLDCGKRLERTVTQYREKYFSQKFHGFGWELKKGSAEIIHKKIKDICIAIPSEAVIPKIHHIEINITLSEKAENLYKRFKNDWLLCMEGKEVEAPNAGVLSGKLLQVCGGAVYDENKEFIDIHPQKLIALRDIIKKHRGEPVLVGYNFKHELIRLKKWFPEGDDIRKIPNAVEKWNAGEIPLMFAHPDSAGHGLNLQKGPGRVLVWFGLNWALDLNKQLNKRLHRPGQKQEVLIYYLIVKGKADSLVMKGIAQKDWTQKQLLKALKRSK